MAAYVITLASHTGWAEEFILWELPLARGLQYQHACLCAEGVRTVPTRAALMSEMEEAMQSLTEPK